MMALKRNLYIFLIAFVLFGAVWYFMTHKYINQPQSNTIATKIQPARPLTAFNLYDDTGKPFTKESLLGHWTLLFFGYAACPDICPQTLSKIRDTWNTYPDSKAPVKFVFASITPEPPDSPNLKNFVQNYHTDFLGVSGSPAAMQELSNQLGIFVQQQSDRLDHTASLMLIDPQGRLSAVITPPFTPKQLSEALNTILRRS